MTGPELKTFAVVLGVGLAACHRSSHVDTELAVLPTSPVVSIRRLTMFSPCTGSFLERTKCQLRGPPETSCIYGLVHTSGRPAPPIDCAAVSGWPGPRADDDAFSLPLDSARSATGATFMIREPGFEAPFDYRYATIPDAGVRVNVALHGGPWARMHHLDAEGVFYSHDSQWSEDAGSLEAPLASLLGRSFWSMRPEQRDEAWPVILREDPIGAALALHDGYDDPSYDRYFATLDGPQREALSGIQRVFYEIWVEETPSGLGVGSNGDTNALAFTRWALEHPESQPAWFMPLVKTVAKAHAELRLDAPLALRGDLEASARLCADWSEPELALSVFAVTGHQCSKVVDMARAPAELEVLANRGGPCKLEESSQRARELLEDALVLPVSLRVDAGVPRAYGCGPFLAAFAVQRQVPLALRRPFERIGYEVTSVGVPCDNVLSEVLSLGGTLTRKRFISAEDPDEGPFDACELAVDDRKRTIQVTGPPPPKPFDPDADE